MTTVRLVKTLIFTVDVPEKLACDQVKATEYAQDAVYKLFYGAAGELICDSLDIEVEIVSTDHVEVLKQ